jgi:hypothetical protein
MYVFMQIVLEFLEFLICEHEGVAGIARDFIVLGKMADAVYCVTNLFVFPLEFFKACPE